VQLNLVDIRPDKASREHFGSDLQLYERFAGSQLLASWEAAMLLPARSDFTAVWRYIAANTQNRQLVEELGCLSRKIARFSGMPCSPGRLRVCLDVFRERGLLSFESSHGQVHILLSEPTAKVDLDRSPIIIKLKQQKGGV